MKPDVLSRSLTLVGRGRAGRSFLRSWTNAGGKSRAISGRDASFESLPDTDLLIVAVPDDAIFETALRLAERVRATFAFHLSGALDREALAPLRRKGAELGSIHPVRPFAGAEGEDWAGAFVTVEGENRAIGVGLEIARAVGARPHRLDAERKPLYHAAASLAAGGAAAVLSVAVRAWVEAGIPEELARKALSGLAERAVAAPAERTFSDAFTGAVARRDAGTVRRHVEALSADARALELYRILAEEILERTPGRGREEEIRGILDLSRSAAR
jgi:predicted short-subunit dehydrogenase-like oxidoreductase (DUF2520 family)